MDKDFKLLLELIDSAEKGNAGNILLSTGYAKQLLEKLDKDAFNRLRTEKERSWKEFNNGKI